jgi:TnpA family transposase
MYRKDTPKVQPQTHTNLRFEGSNESKLSFTSKEIVYSINIKSKLEKNFENILFSPASIRMTSTPTSEFRNTLPTKTAQLKFYKAFNRFNVLEKKKFINLIELT